ncbi:DNA-binding protein [Shewanella marina]|uniref:DNA-binding protein n=1 Tax=Shewanella marina TaxID=487319 RepID=UPI000472A4AD|nr:DNA-binding protein [Shewanella marina]
MTQWLICIDDTDDIGTKGTGEIAQEIGQLLMDYCQQHGIVSSVSAVTRHQLFVHPDIPYTSHNSAMCFELVADIEQAIIYELAVAHLITESAAKADPGIAILNLSTPFDQQALIDFGLSAKQQVKTKQQAYELAQSQQLSLTEHGGTGQGVIGAIAGIGLRLFGNDGRVKGQVHFAGLDKKSDKQLTVADIIAKSMVDKVMDLEGAILTDDQVIDLSGKVKAVYHQHQYTLLVYRDEQKTWCNALKQHLKQY